MVVVLYRLCLTGLCPGSELRQPGGGGSLFLIHSKMPHVLGRVLASRSITRARHQRCGWHRGGTPLYSTLLPEGAKRAGRSIHKAHLMLSRRRRSKRLKS